MKPPAIAVSVSSRTTVRKTGPLAWVLLEDLALRVRPEGGDFIVETNVRQLAGDLGVGKDTVANALGRLVQAGLIRVRSRRVAGRYAGCSYVLDAEACEFAGIRLAPGSFTTEPDPVSPCPVASDTVERNGMLSSSTPPPPFSPDWRSAPLRATLLAPRRTSGASASPSSLNVSKDQPLAEQSALTIDRGPVGVGPAIVLSVVASSALVDSPLSDNDLNAEGSSPC